MKKEIVNSITRRFHKIGFGLKKYSPEIMVVSGVIGLVGSAIMACKATTKVSEIFEDTKEQVDTIHEISENPESHNLSEEYTEEDAKKDLAIVYTQTAVKLIKLYGPAVIIGGASIAAILSGHGILRKRNAALSAAYAAINRSFKEYRGRVVERFGEDLDKELRFNIKSKEVEETVVNEDGTETTVKTTVNALDPNSMSDYAKFFCEGCNGWTKDPELNLLFLKQQQNHANDILKSRGYLFLNEVYDMVGIPRTKEGQVVGWVYDEKSPVGDNFVDFGIYNPNSEAVRNFVNGYERSILLDFNVDGPIWDLLKNYQNSLN